MEDRMEDRPHGADDGRDTERAGGTAPGGSPVGMSPDGSHDPRVGTRHVGNPHVGTAETVVPGALARLGPASWWRLGLVALLGVMVVILALGGGFWQAEPVDVPR